MGLKEKFMKKESDILIGKMIRALDKAAYESGKISDPFAWWPINYIFYDQLYIEELHKSYLKDLDFLKKKYGLKKVAETLKYPTAIWLLLVTAVRAVKRIGLSKKERTKIILDFLKMIDICMSGNIFCEDGKNIIFNRKKIKRVVNATKWVDVRREDYIKKLIGRLHASLLSMDEAIFWNANCATREIHGPYKINYEGKPGQLIVREYYILKAPDLVKELRGFPYESFETYTIYDPTVEFDFPVLNDFTHNHSLPEHTIAFFGKVVEDGKEKKLDKRELLEVACNILEKKSFEISMKVERMSQDEKVLESIRRVYFRVRELRAMVGKGWEPPKELMEKAKETLKTYPKPKHRSITRKQYYKAIDPRIN